MFARPCKMQTEYKLLVNRSRARVLIIILIVTLVSVTSCDPVRTIQHRVTLEVLDNDGAPAANVKVSMKETWDSWHEWVKGTPESQESYFRERWREEPWLEGVTNSQGKAAILIERTGLDWNKSSEPPVGRDLVSNREYEIRMNGEFVKDESRVVMKSGAVGIGQSYRVTILAIEKPKYGARKARDGGQFR